MANKTSKTIRIDGDVWKKLCEMAKPLSDSPNSVLRRVLGVDDVSRRS